MKKSLLILNASVAAWASVALSGESAFLDGITRPEDLALIPGTPWVLVASMRAADGTGGGLAAVDASTLSGTEVIFPKSSAAIDFDRKAYPNCPGSPSVGDFNPHGIAFKSDANNRGRL